MQTLKNLGAILLLLFSALASLESQPAKHVREANVCLARTHYKQFRATDISIDATVLADGMHGAVLLDDRCPDLGLKLGVALPNADGSVGDFRKKLWSVGSPGTLGAKVTGTFIGRLRRDPMTRDIHYDLISVENLRVLATSDTVKP